jgi:hypothetical protein
LPEDRLVKILPKPIKEVDKELLAPIKYLKDQGIDKR